MATFTFTMPDIGEGIAEAEIVAWHKAVGDRVEEDEEFVDMMTDKATVPLESPVTGTITQIAGEEGEMVSIGAMLVVIEVEGEVPEDVAEQDESAAPVATASDAPGPKDAPAPKDASAPKDAPAPKDEGVTQRIETENPDSSDADNALAADPKPADLPAATPAPVPSGAAKVLASPAVRQRAKELGVDLGAVKLADGIRVRHGDLDSFLSYNGGYAPAGRVRADEQRKVIGMRRRIAENMAASKRNIPHFSYVEEVDVTDLETLRGQLNSNRGAGETGRPKLTMLPLLIAAICKTVPDFPMINARYDDEGGVVTRHGAVHLGMAAQTDAGLMVPVIRDAQSRNLWQLAKEIGRLAEAARDGKATSEELQGGTLTVTSLGPLGGVATTPVINRPEVAIIGPNRIIERPMYVSDGQGGERIEKRKLMNISISCDHRVVDGYDAASFVQALKRLLEAPSLILVD